MDQTEDILKVSNDRFVMFPVFHNDIWAMYKKAVSSFWTTEEIDLCKDRDDWEMLSDNERHFIKHILAFFAASDGIVNENLAVRFMNEVQYSEAKAFYAFQIAMETIHSETYSLLIETYIHDTAEKTHLFKALETIPCIQKKGEWAMKWISNKEVGFAERLVAFACVEGIFFSGAFCAIYWLKERGLMPGLSFSNELISRDEGLHTEFAVLLYSKLQNKLSKDTLEDIVKECVEIEKEFIIDSIPCSMLGMNSKLMSQYIEFVADRLLLQLGADKVYHSPNPFDFMERISIANKTNFFEARVSEYSKAHVGQSPKSSLTFGVEEDADF